MFLCCQNSFVLLRYQIMITMETEIEQRSSVFKKLKTYTAEEIVRAGGTTNFAILTRYDTKKMYQIKGEALSDEDFKKAITMLSK